MTSPFRFRLAIATVLAVASFLLPSNASGRAPRVEFDFPHAVEARDVTSPEAARLYPDEKVVEATFHVSVRIVEGSEKELREISFELRTHSDEMRVASFLPRTMLETGFVGDIEIKETNETVGTRGLAIGAAVPMPHGNMTFRASPSADIGRTRRSTRTETTRELPPSRAVVSSGSIHNEHGVFFKLRPSQVRAFENVHEFTIQFVVPRQWRGDWVQLTSRARRIKSWCPFMKTITGEANIYLGVHLAGDREAKRAAYRLAHSQHRFIESRQRSVGERIAAMFSEFVDRSKAGANRHLE